MAVIKKSSPWSPPSVKVKTGHDEVVERGCKWLLNSKVCLIVLGERGNSVTGENPDCIGWKRGISYMLEAKANQSDFLADKRKTHRLNGSPDGIGNYRYYICPKNLIDKDEIPEGWGLLYISKSKIFKIKAPEFIETSFISQQAEKNMLCNAVIFKKGVFVLESAEEQNNAN